MEKVSLAELEKRDAGRKPCQDEIQLLRAIEAQNEKIVPEHILGADYAWLSYYGFIGARPSADVWAPRVKDFYVLPKGKKYLEV